MASCYAGVWSGPTWCADLIVDIVNMSVENATFLAALGLFFSSHCGLFSYLHKTHSTVHYPADCADFACSRVAVYPVAHAKHSTVSRVPLYTLPSTAVYRVEGRHFTPQ